MMSMKKNVVMMAAMCGMTAQAEVGIDSQIPAGNIVFERAEGDQIYLHQERRGTSEWWFYWAFRVRGAEGRTLTFHFTDGEPVGARGAAVSVDKGLTWTWQNRDFTKNTFTYTFDPAGSEVWFSFGMAYTQRDWERFLAPLTGSPFLESAQLAVTPKGRKVEMLRLGCIHAAPHYRVVLTARHHCCEMMASYILEGVIAGVLADDAKGRWLRENVEFLLIPFVDKDGVEDGDQGKNRAPRDHGRDYDKTSLYVETAAIRERVPVWAGGKMDVALDLHCPWIRGGTNELVYQVGSEAPNLWDQQERLGKLLEKIEPNPLGYRQANDLPFGKLWNTSANFAQGMSFPRWAAALPGVRLAGHIEIPYATSNGAEVNAGSARQFGVNLATALWQYLPTNDGSAREQN